MKKLTLSLILAVLCAVTAFGQQNNVYQTTASSAIGINDSVINLTAVTSLVAPAAAVDGHYILIDQEWMKVQSISSTAVSVTRAVAGIRGGHPSGAIAWYGPANWFVQSDQSGSCVTAKLFVHPRINVKNGKVYACYGSDRTGTKTGMWEVMLNPESGDALSFGAAAGLNRVTNIPVGGVAWSGLGTTLSPTTTVTYVASINLPKGKLVTGVSYLAGTTNSGTPHATVAIYGPNGGLPLAYSATTAVTATASIWEDVAFTGTIWLPPGRYFVGVQADASTSHITTLNNGIQPVDLATTSITGGTYGTISSVALTAPTTFTTAVGPIVALY